MKKQDVGAWKNMSYKKIIYYKIWLLLLLFILIIYYFAMQYTSGLIRLILQLVCFNTGMICIILIGLSVFITIKNKK